MQNNIIDKQLREIERTGMHKLTLDERMDLYKNGDYEKLIQAFSLIIRKQAHKLSFAVEQGQSCDDIFQEGILAAWRGINKFNPEVSSHLSSYVVRSAYNAMHDFVNRDYFNTKFSWVDITTYEEENNYYIDTETNNDNINELNYAISLLSDEDRFMINEYLTNRRTLNSIAKEMGLSREWARIKKDRAIDKLKDIIDNMK